MSPKVIAGRYRIEEKLGSTAMGEVYKVTDLTDGSVLALKLSAKGSAQDEIVRFKREFYTLSRLRHPNIVEVKDFGVLGKQETSHASPAESRCYFSMEYVDGEDILRFFDKKHPFGEKTHQLLYSVLSQLCHAVRYIHSNGLVHCDLKPGNILIARKTPKSQGESQDDPESLAVKLLDFGLASEFSSSTASTVAGTLGYIAPEVLRSGKADVRSDLYSLGVIFWEVLARRRAFPGDDPISIIRDNLSKSLPPPSAYDSTTPEELERIVLRLISKEPRDRYSGASGILEELSSIAPQVVAAKPPAEQLSLLTSNLVGRDEVLSAFQSLMGKAKEGEGQVMVLKGERGIGKSRLLRELRFEAQLSGSTVLSGSCCESEKTPFAPWSQILSQLQRADRRDTPHFASQSSGPQGQLEARKLQVFERVASRIAGYSRKGLNALVILVDDLDLADPNGLDFFAYLSVSLQKSKVLLVTFCEKSASLQDSFNRLQELPFATLVELRGLTPEETHLIVSNMLGGELPQPHLWEWVHQQAGGNPLLTEGTISSLVRDSILRRRGTSWSFETLELDKARLSKDVESLIQLWLSRLNKREAKVLSACAVLGDGFDLGVLEELSHLDGHLFFQVLDSLENHNLVRREQGANFAFTHKWAQRVLYKRMPTKKRKALHAKAAEIIEKLYPDRWFDLAEHCLKGEVKAKAYKYSLLAGRRARESFANRDALEYYRHALRLSREVGREEERPRILEEMGDLHNLLGDYDDGLQAYKSAQDMLGSEERELHPLALPTLLRKVATIHHKRGDCKRALDFLREARKLAGRKPESEEMARILNEIGWVHQMQGEYERAFASYNRALKTAKRIKDLGMLSRTHYNLGALFWHREDLERAIRYCERALTIDRQTKDPYSLASSYGLLGAIYFASADWEKAIESYQEGLRLSRETSDIYGHLTSLISLGDLFRRKGSLDEAQEYLLQALPLAEKAGNPIMRAQVHANLGFVSYQKGDWDKALRHYDRGLRALRDSGDEECTAVLHGNLSSLYLNRGDLKGAQRSLRIAQSLREKLGSRAGLGSIYLDMGRFLMEKSQYEKALACLEKSAAMYREEGERFDLATVLVSLAEAWLFLGNTEKALACSKESLELSVAACNPFAQGGAYRLLAVVHFESRDFDKVKENISRSADIFRKLGAKFELGRSLLEAGRLALRCAEKGQARDWLSSARPNLREAEAIFGELGARPYLERARLLLDTLTDRILSAEFDLSNRGKYLDMLCRISQLVNSISSQDELLNQVLDLAINLVGGERGLVLLIDERTNDFFVAAGQDVDKATVGDATKISRTILARVVETGKPVISDDALHDPGFRESNSVVLNKIRSLLCVPLMARGELIGTIYVDSRAYANIFSEMDEEFLVAVANLIGASIDQSKLSASIQRENLSLKRSLQGRQGLKDLIGESEEIERVYQDAEKVAAADCTVLLQGETGTGKELVARAIHQLSNRCAEKFLTIDCGALIETLLESELFGHKKGSFTGATEDKAGLLEEADKGTMFLDEIGDASVSVQAKLLRAIETGEVRRVGETKWRKVNVRVICATNKDLEEEVKSRRFREDLFYRLSTFTIRVPPLRERTGDIYLLANHFRERYRTQFRKDIVGFTSKARNYLVDHPWPGNVRQLEKTIERAVVTCDGPKIALRDVHLASDASVSPVLPLRETKALAESERVRRALFTTQGQVTRAARALGITRRQLYRLMEKHGIKRSNFIKRPSDQPHPEKCDISVTM